MKKIYVTKPFLPPKQEYDAYIGRIWDSGYLTNQGPLLLEFEEKMKSYLGVDNFQFVTNGTIALQIALRSLDIDEGEVITTPFSYVATTSAILWEKLTPVYVDIDEHTLNIDPTKIEAAITPKTKAILAVHVFGNPCDIDSIDKIAKKHNLKVIYDGAHAFGVKYKNKSIFSFGDISTCSFHSTKLFHTIEGGCVIAKDPIVTSKLELTKRFGHNGDEYLQLGINAKASEFQAAMGLCNIGHIEDIIRSRKNAVAIYDKYLKTQINRQRHNELADSNYSYYPIIFSSKKELLDKLMKLNENNIFPRRYFYPSLNNLPYLINNYDCPNSEDISQRILCLPLYHDIKESDIKYICEALEA